MTPLLKPIDIAESARKPQVIHRSLWSIDGVFKKGFQALDFLLLQCVELLCRLNHISRRDLCPQPLIEVIEGWHHAKGKRG